MCDQLRIRPACANAQSDQSLCLTLEYSRSVKLIIEHHLDFLSLAGCCTGSSESTLVKMPHCWKLYVMAKFFNMGYPHSNALLQFPLKSKLFKSYKAASHPRICDVINVL